MKKKIVILIFVLLLIVLNILFFTKFYKVNKIVNLMRKDNLKQNYSCTIILNDSQTLLVKRNKNIIMQVLNENDDYFLNYYNFNENNVYNIIDEIRNFYKRKIEIPDKYVLDFPLYRYLTDDYSFINKLKLVSEWKIEDYGNNKYEITTKDNYKVVFNKNTGLVESVTNASEKKRVYYILEDYQENCVTDEDVALPDLSEYTEVDNIEELGN